MFIGQTSWRLVTRVLGVGPLGQFVAEDIVAEEAHEADFAVETLEEVLGLLGAEAQGLNHCRHRLRAVTQESKKMPLLVRQRTSVLGLVHCVLPGEW
jgi:hypothetical protein